MRRLPLMTLCRYHRGRDGDRDEVVTVVGVWQWREALAGPTPCEMVGVDPNSWQAQGRAGYLLMPSSGGRFIHSFWGEVALGSLVPLFLVASGGLGESHQEPVVG